MKYFENLPKKTFASSVGNFVISDFFTYLDSADLNLTTSNVEVDSKTTLLEAAYTVYNDPNSFWLFLTSNKTVNPFNLLATNVNIFITDNENKIGLNLVSNPSGSTAFGYPQGSIVVPYIGNTGASSAYSSIGNFDLNGPLTLIEDVSFYSADMVIKAQQGGTFISSDGVTGSGVLVITPIEGGTFSIQKILYPSNTKKAIETVVKVELSEEGQIEEIGVSDKYSGGKKSSSSSSTITVGISGGTDVSALTVNQLSSKNINAIVQSQVGLLKSYFVSAKYN
jgi:hypothetical protein